MRPAEKLRDQLGDYWSHPEKSKWEDKPELQQLIVESSKNMVIPPTNNIQYKPGYIEEGKKLGKQ